MKELVVELGERSYTIKIGRDLGFVKDKNKISKAIVVSDSNVFPLYGGECCKQYQAVGVETNSFVIKAGEASKNFDELLGILSYALDVGLDRTSAFVALGGGVVGDICGFASSVYMRGIKYVQIPTSLLAMVDSSVGGKTAVNMPQGKNLIGSFYQPVEVIIDINTLKTLPKREYVSGLAEVIKYGIIKESSLFDKLDENKSDILDSSSSILEDIIFDCCRIKAEVVSEDERESGIRAILNFGHTLAHAIETVCGFGKYLHGEAVSIGMVYALRLSTEVMGFLYNDYERARKLLLDVGLPVNFEMGTKPPWESILNAMVLDKKSKSGVPKFVLVESLGNTVIDNVVPVDLLKSVYEKL